MGMYTTLFLAVQFKEETPTEIIETIDRAVTGCGCLNGSYINLAPKFGQDNNLEHLSYVFNHFSFYQRGPSISKLDVDSSNLYRLLVYSSFKNYNNEINTLIDWLKPWVDVQVNQANVIGWHWYEEDERPTLIEI